MYRQMYQPLFCTCYLHPSLCLQSYLKKAEQYEHQKYQIWWKSNLCPFLSHCICSEQNVGGTNCAENYWKEATHLSRRSQFLHHPMVSLLSTIQNIHPLTPESTTQQELSPPATARHLHVHFADERNCEQPGKPRSEI